MKKAVMFTLEEDTHEMLSLLQTLGVEVEREFLQRRSYPHKVSFLGPGRINEAYKEIESLDIDLIVINGVLRPSQHHFLEMKFQMECIDRPGVILRIFADHAHTPEAIAQVTLAKLRYEVPFLREWIHKAKSGDRPGFLAGGAYATDVYYEHAKAHARRIEKRLRELSRQRETIRVQRRSRGYTLVSLAGYTNGGKSALLNKMCGSEVTVDDKLFSTLSTTTRRVPGIKGNVLMTDTVGFIKDLPPELIEAFQSTLEEMFYADVILLVFDASEDEDAIRMKLSTSMKTLLPRIESRSLIVVGSKIDLVSKESYDALRNWVSPLIAPYELFCVSSITGEGIKRLSKRIEQLQNRSCLVNAQLPMTDESYRLLSRLRSIADVKSSVTHSSLEVQIRCKPDDSQRIVGWAEAVGASSVVIQNEPAEAESEPEISSNGKEGGPL